MAPRWLGPTLLLLLLLLAGPSASYSYRDPRHMQQPPPRPAVYDVEVHEVDSATLHKLLAGQQGGLGAQGQPNRFPQGQQGQPWAQPPRPQPATGPGTETKAHFVSPSGQVYTLQNMNGVPVLVGPDGRWHPLNANGNGNVGGQSGFPGGLGGQGGSPGQLVDSQNEGTPTQPPRRPPGPSGASEEDEDSFGFGSGSPAGGPKGTRDAEDCVTSQTTFNGGRRACRYQLLLDEHFDVLNLTRWKHDVLIPAEPDFEFVVYDKDPDNSFVDKSILHIKPTLLEDSYGPGFVMNGTLNLDGCTSSVQDQCSRTASTYRVLPTVRSARLTTRDSFTFRYGIVEARVLVPEGDWIYPAITLEPATSMYGRWYAGGQVRLPYAVGNRFLSRRVDGPRTGLQVMHAGVALGKTPGSDIQPTVLLEKQVRAANNSNWRKKHFRVYRVKWTPESIEFSLDGKSIGTIRPPPGGFVSLTDSPSDHPWRLGSEMAPFDQEFFVSLGVGVGGVNRFADGGANGEYNEHPKPWKNSSPKALLDFYKARDHWIPTWFHPDLEIAHIKVMAL